MVQRKKAAIATSAEKSICLVQPFHIYINNNNNLSKTNCIVGYTIVAQYIFAIHALASLTKATISSPYAFSSVSLYLFKKEVQLNLQHSDNNCCFCGKLRNRTPKLLVYCSTDCFHYNHSPKFRQLLPRSHLQNKTQINSILSFLSIQRYR